MQEFLDSDYTVFSVYSVAGAGTKMNKIPENTEFIEITANELEKISNHSAPQEHLALVKMPKERTITEANTANFKGKFTMVLDDVQDPGNLGTIIRLADWFGLEHVICSIGSVDAYNPKTVQATMGSLSRVKVIYMDLNAAFRMLNIPVFGAVLDGESIYDAEFGEEGLLLFGNEGRGISAPVMKSIKHPLTIPRIGHAESLNVAISAALFCSEVTRRK